MATSLHDLMLACGVRNHPTWYEQIPLPFWPMPHQMDMIHKYPRNMRFGDFSDPGAGKTYPAQVHAILMASMGNKVVFVTLPALIPQFMDEFETFFPGIGKRLKIEDIACSAAQKKKREARWDAEGWPDILVMSYSIYRMFNDKNSKKKIGNNLWKIRNTAKAGTPEEFSTNYWKEDGTAYDHMAQPYTADGRMVDRRGKAENTRRMLLKERGYNVLFFDEGDALCGLDSILSQSVSSMSLQLRDEMAIYVMTGSPIPTKLHNAYGLIRLINPSAYKNVEAFKRKHCVEKEFTVPTKDGRLVKRKDIVSYINTDGIYEALWKNAHRVQKRDVLSMPAPIISEVPVKLAGAHLKLYRSIINDHFAMLGDQVLAPDNQSALRHLALQIISSPGEFDPSFEASNELAKATGELVQSINPGPKRKLIIFAYYQKAIESLAKQFAHLNVAVVYGKSPDRQGQLDKFLHDDECSVIVIQWVSGGAGLNLQVAGYIIFYETPTSPKAAKQAIARADRKGQQNIVNVYFMRVLKTLADRNFKSLLANDESNNRAIKDKHDLLYELLVA